MDTTTVVYEPVGACGFITPWNWPLNQIAAKVAPAPATGCTMVLKPSEIAPLNALVLAEILDEAGVPAGVFNLVNGDGRRSAPLSRHTPTRVLDAVRVLNYTPNESARSLKRRSTSTIGLVVPDLTNQFFALVAEGVERAASERDLLVVLCAPEATEQPESHHAKLLRSQRLDGVVYLSGAGRSPAVILELSRSGTVVLVDEQISGFDLPSVVCDGRRGAREVAAHVLAAGHRRVAIIGGPVALWTAEQRLAGYREAIAAAGLEPDAVPVLVGDYRQASGTELAAQALAGPPHERPTALLCANDLMAIGALEHCKASGIRVPEDVSIVGFDDLPLAALLTPRLTTVCRPAREMGHRAATLLFGLLREEADGDPHAMLETTLQVRDSVAPPPAGA